MATLVNYVGKAVELAGIYVGEKIGAYVVPSIVAPTTRGVVGWMYGNPSTYTQMLAKLIATEEAGAAAFQLAKGVAPAACAVGGGIAGQVLFQAGIYGVGYAGNALYKSLRAETPKVETNTNTPRPVLA